jgi:hypothetical protein
MKIACYTGPTRHATSMSHNMKPLYKRTLTIAKDNPRMTILFFICTFVRRAHKVANLAAGVTA